MAAFKFIHTSDLHLGRRFSAFPETIRGRLFEERREVLRRLKGAAREHGAQHVLIAGDLFDTETPSADVWKQALAEMRAAEDITWIAIPGNHDSLAAEQLWANVQDAGGMRVLTEPKLTELIPGVVLLPAPVPSRSPGRDLTEWMEGADTSKDWIRIGLAHGNVQDFGAGEEEIIPRDRATTARLDYLALGDWHGFHRITEATWYSGTPERDRFKHTGRGKCLAVTIPAPGSRIDVNPVETGRFDWEDVQLHLTPEQDVRQVLESALLTGGGNRHDLLRKVRATGSVRLPAWAVLEHSVRELRSEFGYLELLSDTLRIEYDLEDLDQISNGGALRKAADELQEEATNSSVSAEVRRIADGALQRLYSYVVAP